MMPLLRNHTIEERSENLPQKLKLGTALNLDIGSGSKYSMNDTLRIVLKKQENNAL